MVTGDYGPVIHTQIAAIQKVNVDHRSLGVGALTISSFFHFSENCQVRQVGPNEALNRNKRISIRVDTRFARSSTVVVKNQSWAGSRTFGVKEASFNSLHAPQSWALSVSDRDFAI
jgi:hypothetical protein